MTIQQSLLSRLFFRMVGYLLLLLFSFSLASELENLQKNSEWPLICENHPQAIKVVSSKFSEDQGAWCNLTFPFASEADERTRLCSDLFMDSLESTSGDAFTTTCNYKRFARCDEGFTLVSGLCYKLHDGQETFEGADKKCESLGGSMAGYDNEVDLKFLMYAANPVKYGIHVKSIWISSSEQMVFARSVEAPAVPGTVVPAFQKTSHFYCVKNILRSRTSYERICNIMKNTFKLHAIFESGNCFMLSPSVSIDLGLGSRKDSFDHFNSECRWITDQDYSVSPVTDTRKKGMISLMNEYNLDEEVIIPAYKEFKNWYIMNKNIQKGEIESEVIGDGAFIFALNEPTDKGDLGSTGLVMGIRADNYKLKGIPAFARKHRICMSGVSINEMPRTSCNDKNSANPHLREGWKSLLRDDGKVMCAKAVIADLNENKPEDTKWYNCLNYTQMKEVCAKADAYVTPVQSAEEQALITDLVATRMREVNEFVARTNIENPVKQQYHGAGEMVWLGAIKGDPIKAVYADARFYWDYDKKEMGYKNYANGEPNYANGIEECLQMYTTGSMVWNDISCGWTCHHLLKLIGGVCARFIED